MKKILGILLLVTLGPLVACADDPHGAEPPTLYLRGGTLHRVNAPDILDGVLGIQGGKIVFVGKGLESPLDGQAKVIDVSGQHIYPGFIDADTTLGLVEIEAVRATNDTIETGLFNSNAEAITAFNPDSELIPVARADGILTVLSAPRGFLVTGRSAVMRLDGWHSTDMAIRRHVGLHVVWPSSAPAFRQVPSPGKEKTKESHQDLRQRQLQRLAEFFEDAQGATGVDPAGRNLRLEAVRQALVGEIALFVHTDELRSIVEAVEFADRFHCKLVIVGGYDAPECTDLLKKHGVAVIVTGTQRLPAHASSPYDEPFTVPVRLLEAGVPFCISGHDRFSASGIRNLPQHAGVAAAFGLPPEQALRAITLSAAEILGIADRLGSLDVGKDATFIAMTGDPLEIETQILSAYIAGREVDLDTKQKRLWRKYKARYEDAARKP